MTAPHAEAPGSRHAAGRLGKALAAGLMLTTCLTAGSALAQSGRELDRLLSAAPGVQSVRSVDLSTRAAKRYAVVIGNSDYSAIPDLPNAHADANAMAAFFKDQGYDVHFHLDITKRGFEDALRRVLFDVDKDTEVVVFFAGHGFQIGSENYLVPVDADLDTIYDVPFARFACRYRRCAGAVAGGDPGQLPRQSLCREIGADSHRQRIARNPHWFFLSGGAAELDADLLDRAGIGRLRRRR